MKRKLEIHTPGYILEFGGTQYRTPAIIDITKLDMHIVIMKLRAAGISMYHIKSEEETIKKIPGKVKNKPKDQLPNQKVDLDTVLERFDKVEKILEILTQNQLRSDSKNNGFDLNTPVIEELSEEDFIPVIDLGNMTSSGESIQTKQIENDYNIDKIASDLKKTTPKKTYTKGDFKK